MRDRAEVVIIGAGIMGLSIAYHLAKNHGITDVIVVEQGYLCSGASGRNGGGVRAQFSSEENVRLMLESKRLCSEFAKEMKINVWYRQGGYLFLVNTPAGQENLERSVAVQNGCGHATNMLSPAEVKKLVPELDVTDVRAAAFNGEDAVVFPWPFVWGYANVAQRLGVDIETFCRVEGFRSTGKRIDAVLTNKGSIKTHRVVNAAGAWSPQVAKHLDVELPNHPHRHEICATEPLKPWLGPLVANLETGMYFSQSTRGEIVGGITDNEVPPGIDVESSRRFLSVYADAVVKTCPILAKVKVLRQWAGCYDLTPDANPIVGPVDDVDDFYQASGFQGHGFMIAPVMGRLIAQHIAEATDLPLFERWNLRRYKEGRLLTETMIIG